MVKNGGWIHIPSPKFKYIKITHTGSVWGVTLDDKIYVKNKFENSWIEFECCFSQISVY
jgi:hypothetical protein